MRARVRKDREPSTSSPCSTTQGSLGRLAFRRDFPLLSFGPAVAVERLWHVGLDLADIPLRDVCLMGQGERDWSPFFNFRAKFCS